MEYIIAIAIIVLVVVLYIVSYAINEKTAIPEECRDLVDQMGCSSCTNGGCSIKKKLPVEENHVK